MAPQPYIKIQILVPKSVKDWAVGKADEREMSLSAFVRDRLVSLKQADEKRVAA